MRRVCPAHFRFTDDVDGSKNLNRSLNKTGLKKTQEQARTWSVYFSSSFSVLEDKNKFWPKMFYRIVKYGNPACEERRLPGTTTDHPKQVLAEKKVPSTSARWKGEAQTTAADRCFAASLGRDGTVGIRLHVLFILFISSFLHCETSPAQNKESCF